MTKSQRSYYHGTLWPAVCRAQDWEWKDEARRRECTLEATGTESTTGLDQHQITALFARLGHLAGFPAASETWSRIQRVGARAVNLQKIGEHHRDLAGIAAGGRLDMERFRKLGDGDIAPEMCEAEAEQYAMTMRGRNRRNGKDGRDGNNDD